MSRGWTLALLLATACSAEPPARDLPELEARLERMRTELRIPGLSTGIAKGGRLVWSRGFGLADVENGIAAGADTSYHVASLTKTFASVVLLQLVEEGRLDLDDPISKFGILLGAPGAIRVRHLLTHTSSGTPGSVFLYDGDRFGLLSDVIQQASGSSFGKLVSERLIIPMALEHTAPNVLDGAFALARHDRAAFEANLARGYTLDDAGRARRTAYPGYFGAAAGLISSVTDLAVYSAALDGTALLGEESKLRAWSPTISSSGGSLPYGMGWFVQTLRGVKIVWHYGYWIANSSLIIKVPERDVTFIILANSDGLSAQFPLGRGDVTSSPFARQFIDAAIFGGLEL